MKELWDKVTTINLYYASMTLLLVYFAYLAVIGKRITGSDSEKWAAKGVHQYHHK